MFYMPGIREEDFHTNLPREKWVKRRPFHERRRNLEIGAEEAVGQKKAKMGQSHGSAM